MHHLKCLCALLLGVVFLFLQSCENRDRKPSSWVLNEMGYYEGDGINVFVFSNWYNGLFSDSKISGIELIHHEVRTATNGDVRLQATPEQWDEIPTFVERKTDSASQAIEAVLSYPKYNFTYRIRSVPKENGLVISVHLDEPLPASLKGKAGFNLEFLPSAYFGKSFLMNDKSGIFPIYPSGPMQVDETGRTVPLPIAQGDVLVLAPEDEERRVKIKSSMGNLSLYDGRNKAQNGWFVVRSMLPAEQSGKVLEWFLTAGSIPNWKRKPVIAHSQVGYHPHQKKMAVIELDNKDQALEKATMFKILPSGNREIQSILKTQSWGKYLRYKYLTVDFSEVEKAGLYTIKYGDQETKPFRIDKDVYQNAWQPTLDVFFPVQMDHMFVNEAYRVWHGASHLDDALQAPLNHEHFDLYAQGPSADSPYQPGQHIPGLNVGGWYDAGDYDIRTQTQYYVLQYLVKTWEQFRPIRDETTIDQKYKYVDMHHPDGFPDILQQIEHGALALVAQFKAVGHAIPGIIVPRIDQYTHLGDGMTMTDNLVFNGKLDSAQSNGFESGTFDDRWAFTSKSSALNYGAIASLAAVSRSLKGFKDELANTCLKIAIKEWDNEHLHEPDTFRYGNTTGGPLWHEELKAAVELLVTTKAPKYKERIKELWPFIDKGFRWNAVIVLPALPQMDKAFKDDFRRRVIQYRKELDTISMENPYGVPISRGGWAGNGQVISFGITNYCLHKAFPEIISVDYTIRSLNYILGIHPGSSISFVSGVGMDSKMVAYGSNRADYSYIAGGIVPGVLILSPDFPENKEDWPFLWGENEYVISVGASYLFLANAVHQVLNAKVNSR